MKDKIHMVWFYLHNIQNHPNIKKKKIQLYIVVFRDVFGCGKY